MDWNLFSIVLYDETKSGCYKQKIAEIIKAVGYCFVQNVSHINKVNSNEMQVQNLNGHENEGSKQLWSDIKISYVT